MNSALFSQQVPETVIPPVSFDSIPLMLSPLSADNSSDCKKPRKNRSAYTLFALEIKPTIKSSTNAKLSCVDLQTRVSQLWKALSPEERKKYHDQANEEKLHYMLKLKKFYENATPEALEEATKPKPKRPYSAYCYFVKEVRQAIKLPEAKFKMQDILKHASEKWRLLSEEQKAVYHERAKKAKQAYMSEAADCNETAQSLRLQKLSGNAKKSKKGDVQEVEAKKRGVFFSKDIQEKMDGFSQENPIKKVKIDLKEEDIYVKIDSYGSPETTQSGTMKSGRQFGTPLSLDDNESFKFDIKQEKIEEKVAMFPQMPIQVNPAQYWPAYAMRQPVEAYGYNMNMPQFWNMKAQMVGGVNPNLMNFMMYEQMRRQMVQQMMMMNQISETASQDSYSDTKIEVKSENF